MKNQLRLSLLLSFLLPLSLLAQKEKIDKDMMNKIRQEGLNNSKIMDIAFHLTDESGPRLTGSPGFYRAANYAREMFNSWGMVNSHLDEWGEFGKSWELEKSYVALATPWYKPLIGFPKTWTAGTNGLQNGKVMFVSVKDSVALQSYAGKLAGKILITDRTDTYNQSFKADAFRVSDADLDSMSKIEIKEQVRDTAAAARRREQMRPMQAAQRLLTALKAMAIKEGALGILTTSPRNHDGTVFVQQAGPYKLSDPANLLDIALSWEDYMTILRLAKANEPVSLDLDVRSRFITSDTKGYNVIAEIKGSDRKLQDEVVMLGGHLDSWHGGTGATDNAAGCAIMMEAARILKTLGVKPRRTIRIALWSGEEEGLLGSRGYVKKTFGDPETMQLLPAHEKFSAYYNVDNGSGKIRGIFTQQNKAVRDIFDQWLAPFADLGAKTTTLSNTGSTDHVSFDAVGLPGFQFIQDDVEYFTRTHHSNMDTYDHLFPEDLKQAAVIVAAFVYNTAQRDDKLPRKELPKPRPQRQF